MFQEQKWKAGSNRYHLSIIVVKLNGEEQSVQIHEVIKHSSGIKKSLFWVQAAMVGWCEQLANLELISYIDREKHASKKQFYSALFSIAYSWLCGVSDTSHYK